MSAVRTWLVLGRVSNLPTVWTNALAGVVLAGSATGVEFYWTALVLTAAYVGGMYLNDAFDAEIDAAERSSRPIPAGEVDRNTVFAAGYALLLVSVLLAFVLGTAPGLAAVALAAAIVIYDWLHKKTASSPVIMGACRFLSYAVAALAVTSFAGEVLHAAIGMWFYIIGLTHAAKQEAYDRIERAWPLAVLAVPILYAAYQSVASGLAMAIFATFAAWTAWALHLLFRRDPGDVPKAVVSLIAGICLYDAVLIAATGQTMLAAHAVAAFALTLLLQRFVPGT